MSNKIYNYQQALEHAKSINNNILPFVLFRVKHNPHGLGGSRDVWFVYDKEYDCLSSMVGEQGYKHNNKYIDYAYCSYIQDGRNSYKTPAYWGDTKYNNTFELIDHTRTQIEHKPIEFIDLIKQPTYNHIIDNLEQIRQMACAKIMSITTEQLYDSMLSQANKGLVKYGMLIDDNHNFDSDQYTLEEITDLIIYIANKEVKKTKNPVSEFEGILKGKTNLTVDEFNRISNLKRDDEWLRVKYELQKQAWKENDNRFGEGWIAMEQKARNKKNNSNHNV